MRAALLALAASPLVLAAGHGPRAGAHAAPARRSAAGVKRASGYSLTKNCEGDSFLDCFQFDTTAGNGGIANFVDEATAKAKELFAVKNGKFHMRVHPVADNGALDAIKLATKEQYSEGLYIWDVERMPQVCGVWPAIWSTGDDWPNNGEIDVVEYVSHQSMNSMSVHTGTGCWAGSTGYTGKPMMQDKSKALNCDADATSSQGCGFRTADDNTAGIGANYKKDGVYAVEWSSAGIKGWFFPRDSIPSDITSKNPDPSSWDTPVMYISADSCNPSTYFGPQTWIINTQLCGTWAAGTVWNTDNSYAGQEGSCASMTGHDTCESYVLNTAHDFKHAYWRIGSFRIYNQ
ncbi:hypothetical protein JCM10213_004712 [Rhodosporidiobolus nylandii]